MLNMSLGNTSHITTKKYPLTRSIDLLHLEADISQKLIPNIDLLVFQILMTLQGRTVQLS